MEHKNKLFYRHNQELLFDFTGTCISSDGGLLLLEKLERQQKMIKFFTDLLLDKRQQGKIDYSLEDLLEQRIFAMAMGYEDCNDVQRLNGDVAFGLTCGKLASQPTFSRFKNNIRIRDIYRLCIGFIDRYVQSLSPDRKRIIIDVDATDDPTHGAQQLSMFNGYYGHTAYTELLFHDGDTGQLILPVLRPGNAHSNKWFIYCLTPIVERIKIKCPDAEIILRADTSENRIKELKSICFSDRLSCHKFTANFFRLLMSGICYEVLRTIREKIIEGGFEQQGKWDQQINGLNQPASLQ